MPRAPSCTLLAASIALAASGFSANALAATLDPALEPILQTGDAIGPLEVIVSFHGEGPLGPVQLRQLEALGLNGITLESLPMVGVRATPDQIRELDGWDEVRSIWLNHGLTYDNREATALSGVDRLRTDPVLRSNGVPFSGRGVAVLVNDSGIDGTHPDLKFPRHVVQNVAAQTNLNSVSGLLPVTRLEDMPNTDIAGGHGTHVAGTVGGSGAASSGARYEGVAPGADIVGYGSGAGLFILDTLGGFDYALSQQARYNIRVVSNSFGSTSDTGTDFNPDHPTNIATKALADRGVIVVFSAGNSGPGEGTITGNFKKAPWVVTVAAGDKSGGLASFSSRGEDGRGGEVNIGGETLVWVDRPTITAPGVNIYSARAAGGPLDAPSLADEIEEIGPGDAVYYSRKSGTSMAAPHISGVVALMLEANPSLDWRGVKRILEDTASNITGRAPWEVGAGYVNAYAAVQAALEAGDFGATPNLNRSFNANALTSVASNEAVSFQFSPVGETGSVSFEVGADISLVTASANIGDNTLALVLIDPLGRRYGSSIALPVLGQNVATAAPGIPGTWTLTARGVGAVSGVALDPLQVTNGYGTPGTVNARLKQVRTDGFTGLADIAGHPGQGFIEFAVSRRLVDADANGRFRPDDTLRRRELADFMVMGLGVRQSDPLAGPTFSDVGDTSALYPLVEAVSARGGALRDTFHQHDPLVRSGARFNGGGAVTHEELAYSLVQSLGLQEAARAHSGDVVVHYDGKRIVLGDQHNIAPALRGYVQLALDAGLLPATFAVRQGPFDLQPVVTATFDPKANVSRAAYAAAASRLSNL